MHTGALNGDGCMHSGTCICDRETIGCRSIDGSVLEPMKDSGKGNDQTGNNNYLHTLFDS